MLFIDLITLPFNFSIYGKITQNNDYRFGQLFSSEPNWLTIHFITICLLFFVGGRINQSRTGLPSAGAILLDLSLNGSRAAFLLLIGVAPIILRRWVIMALFIVLLALVLPLIILGFDIIAFLPYEMTYDIISLDKNPRINDALHIFPQLEPNLIFGVGYGDLNTYTESMSWREEYPVVNQMWLQILGMSGISGIIFWLFIIFKLAINLKGFYRYFVLLFVLLMQLHNSMFMPIPYIAFALTILFWSYEQDNIKQKTTQLNNLKAL